MKLENRNPIIFNIAGKSGSGKSEVAQIIGHYYHKKRSIHLQYSYYVKMYAKTVLGWDGNEKTKPRDFLNYVGIELIKDTIDENFAIRRMIEDIRVYSYFYDIITISDTRFVSEIERIKEVFKGVITINVKSDAEEKNLTEEQKKHRTNHGLDNYQSFDYEIENNETKEKLQEKVIQMIEEVDRNEY